MTDAPNRVFLGWDRPCLESACALLVARHRDAGHVSLTDTIVVVPGGRPGRTLLALLVEASDEAGLALSPPTMITPGEIGDTLLPPVPGRRVAPALVRRLAWIEALRRVGAEGLAPLVRRAPEADDLVRWSALAGMLESRHAELAGAMLRFEDVPARAEAMPDFPDDERWMAAAEVQRGYESILEGWGVFDPALERLRAAGDEACAGAARAQDVVLIGIAELNAVTRTIIERSGARITSMVFAPDTMAGRFDELGCVRADAWAQATIDLDDDRILVAEGPEDQADAAFEALGALDAEFATDEIIIGVPDESVVPYLRQRAGRYGGVEVRYAGGTPVARTPVFRLLAEVADYLETGSFDALAALVRHPDVERIIEGRLRKPGRCAWWIDAIDTYRSNHVQEHADGRWLEDRRLEGVEDAFRAVRWLLEPLHPERVGAGAPRAPIDRWGPGILDVLGRVYGGVNRNRLGVDRIVIEACFKLKEGIEALARHTGGLEGIDATPAQALRLLLESVRTTEIAERPGEETIELLGWLELAMETAPVLVVTGMNEGVVPSTVVGDAMLPDGLRRVLGIADDRRRLARDAYLLSAIVASRPHACLITGRRNPEGDPLKPSRLLLKCDERTAGARLARLTADGFDERRRVRLRDHLGPGSRTLFRPGIVVDYPAIDAISVTAFRSYLASPYQFFLRYVAGTEEREDEPRELDPRAFGSLIHQTLDAFGKSDAKDLADAKRIEAAVMDQLASVAKELFGDAPRASVAIQIELARLRLREFAARQADRMAKGWRIIASEWTPAGKQAPFDVDGRPIGLKGKIDRIDLHEATGRYAIIDYKTGDSADNPDKAHRGRDGWRDLQLPLYRHLAAELGIGADVELGYFALPKKPDEVDFTPAKWGEADLREADDVARDVVRKIRAGRFDDIGTPGYVGSGAVARLCGFGLLDEGDDAAGGAGGAEGAG